MENLGSRKGGMNMLLTDIEEKILLAIYSAKVNGGKKVEIKDFDLVETDPTEQTHEFAYYCKNLERYGLIENIDKAFATGGSEHPKYNNNAIIAWPEALDITKAGTEYVEKNISA